MYFLSEESKWSYLGDKNYIPYKDTGDGELVLYDFNMQPGDIYPYRFGHSIVFVTNVSRVTTLDGVSRRLLTLSNGYELMEGLGCLNSPGMLFCYLNPNPEMKRWEGIQLTLAFTFKGDLETVDYTRVADLSPSPGIERGTAQSDPVVLDLCYLGLEFRYVAVIVEEFVRHGMNGGRRCLVIILSVFTYRRTSIHG